MDLTWQGVDDLGTKLNEMLSSRYPGEVTKLHVSVEGDTIVLSGEVASEGCRGAAKRQALAFERVFKVANRLEVAAFLEGASGSSDEDDYFERGPRDRATRSTGTERRPRAEHPVRPQDYRRNPIWEEILTKSVGGGSGRMEGPGIEYASFEQQEEPDSVEVSRYPTVQKSGEIAAGANIDITVDLTTEGDAGQPSIAIGSFAADWTEIEVSVQIAGDWLRSVTPAVGSVTLRRYGPTTPAKFACIVSADYVRGAPAEILVYYLHGTRICGHLRRDLAAGEQPMDDRNVEKRMGSETAAGSATAASAVTVAPEASGAALTVMISELQGNQQHWAWRTYGPEGYTSGSDVIALGSTAKAFSDALLLSCPDLPTASFRRTMRGVGEVIWRKAPDKFRQAYVECRAKLGQGFPIQFSTDDPHVPWEMMKPDIQDGTVDHLYIEHPVARWPLNAKGPMRPEFGSGEIVSFVPDYPTQKLISAVAESGWICATLGAVRMDPTREAFLDLLDGNHTAHVRLIHFAGHGMADSGSNDGGIRMEDTLVQLMDVYQSSVVIGRRDHPLLVLNACEASAGSEMLGMNTGWGAAVAATGFGGLIAPLWAVQDTMAYQMAQDTLPDLVGGRITLGGAVQEARRKNADASVAALAYLTHGDVMARFATS